MFDKRAARLVIVLGILTIGVGVYFALLRPPLLPEDVRFTGIDAGNVDPGLARWLRIVFRTCGGFIAAFGLLILSVAVFMMTLRVAVLCYGTAVALLLAFGVFLMSNILIHSDFLWFIGLLFVLAAVTTLRLALAPHQKNRYGPAHK